ncbi:hypothetical protein HOK51_00345 [Candidatus Woesearchaeota archaeon]|jgi:hypothetical protein|nr:hypothetical protein [Candidatus Woesearchaeota archaeon]MBT6518262.1 hypothetical protein [Candidatus Woesearchaeota archaeon]MBT7367567.1 hypothetical protein [Candidatus Woesearchaeota archaeon]
MNLHNRIIDEIVNNQVLLEAHIEMYDSTIETEVSLSQYGDIDIMVTGIDYELQEPATAIIEVKAHRGLVDHYIKHQLPKYKTRFPEAKQFVVFSRGGDCFENFVFERC